MSTQQTLTGEKADSENIELPSTLVECDECGEIMLRSRRFDHEHDVFQPKCLGRPESEQEDEEDDEPEEVGSYYTVEMSYSITYRFNVPAVSEKQAEEIAKDWKMDASPSHGDLVHKTVSEGSTLTTEDVPDDYDMYGSERLHEAVDRASETGGKVEDPREGE